MKKLIIILIVALVGVQSCTVGTHNTWKDDGIDHETVAEIEALDKIVLTAITTNDVELIKTVMADKLIEVMGDNLTALIDQGSNVINNQEYRLLNQYYVKNTATGISNTVMSAMGDGNDYVVKYKALNKEMFVSMIIPKSEIDEFIVLNIYGKYPEGWKLNIIQFGQYKVDSKTAYELYSEAKEDNENGFLVDAANKMFISSRVANPGNNFWEYEKQEEMKAFYEKMMTDFNTSYKFPKVIESIEPQILNIYPFGTRQGYFPMVEYVSTIDLKDTISTRLEKDKIHQIIDESYKGLTLGKKLIFYKAYEEMPDGEKLVTTYTYIEEEE